MSIAVRADARVKAVSVTDDLITFHLVDGRVISAPLPWSWRLTDATPEQRNNYEIIGDGHGSRCTCQTSDEVVECSGLNATRACRRLSQPDYVERDRLPPDTYQCAFDLRVLYFYF